MFAGIDGPMPPNLAKQPKPPRTTALSSLAHFGRYGIPFNVVYGPDAPAGIALPELLSAEAVLDAAARADATAVIAGGR